MFVYTMRGSSIRFFSIVAVALAALICLIVFIPSEEPPVSAVTASGETIRYDKVKTADDRIAFLEQFGWKVSPEPAEEITITIPSDFDKVMTSYNELQKQQGLDLSKYKGKEVTRYTYVITNYEGYNGTVYANIILYKNRVIGGDVCSSDAAGFIYTLAGK